jgi:Bacterial SCP ortholog
LRAAAQAQAARAGVQEVPGSLDGVARLVLDAMAAGVAEESAVRLATRGLLDRLATRAPGSAVEVRVPPYAAVQCIGGARHTRGTPPAVVETGALTWLELAVGRLTWSEAVAGGTVTASGERSDLSPYLPLVESAEDTDGRP